ERSDEQFQLSAKARQRQMEVEERHRQVKERHLEAMRVVDEEIGRTLILANFRELVMKPFDGTQDPHTHLQAFQTQMYISRGNDFLSCKLFLGTLRGLATLPARTIRLFHNLAVLFVSQFAANKVKRLEMADLFDLSQTKGESLKSYLARFNNATVQVNNSDQKFFVKVIHKGLRVGQFSDALALRQLSSMEEIRRQAEKHIEAEEDLIDQLEAERQPLAPQEPKPGTSRGSIGETKYQIQPQPQASNT
ncbi:hypothetical protein CR513_18946, partial [Mucuna pruriens]